MLLKNKNIIFIIRRSKVTDYAALMNDRLTSLTAIKIKYHIQHDKLMCSYKRTLSTLWVVCTI